MNPFVDGSRLTPTDHQYNEVISDVLENGNLKGDRTGTGTIAVVGRLARYSLLNRRSPRPTTKKVTDNPEREMLWFRNGSSSIKELRDQNIGIWNSWLTPGSAKYRPATEREMIRRILKARDVKSSFASFEFYPSKETEDGKMHMEINDRFKTPQGQVYLHPDTFARLENDDDGPAHKTFRERAFAYVCRVLGLPDNVLIDGDIGDGGYGPQWRHWKDTQLIRASEFESYMEQGYKRLGVIDPVIDIKGEEAIKAALETFFLDKGYKYASIGSADPVMVPACGYEMVGDKEHGVHVLYLNEEALTKAYMVALDIPRIVVHREIDQLANAANLLRTNPDSRRIIVSAWNPALIWKAALPPCHLYFQFISHELTVEQRAMILADRVELEAYDLDRHWRESDFHQSVPVNIKGENFDLEQARLTTENDEQIHAQLDDLGIKRRGLYCFLLLRSNDLGLGQPFNVAQYAALTHMVAQVTDMEALELVWTAVDAHVYANHVDALRHQLTLDSKSCIPRLGLNPDIKELDDFTIEDIEIIDYQSHEPLTSQMPPAV